MAWDGDIIWKTATFFKVSVIYQMKYPGFRNKTPETCYTTILYENYAKRLFGP
jgi:hypothetical protein